MRELKLHVLACLLVVTSLMGCQSAGTAVGEDPAAAPASRAARVATADSPLKKMQAVFRPTYDWARDEVDRQISPLVVVRLSDMFLIKEGITIAEGKGIPQKYHLLHRTAHVPFVIALRLQPLFGERLPTDVAQVLKDYQRLVEDASSDLVDYGFSEEEIAWQSEILEETATFLASLKESAVVDERRHAQYQARVHRPMMALADSAGAAQVDATHATMRDWRKKLSDAEWKQLRVIIVGFRQPRHNYAATQYFAALFPDAGNSLFPGESRRVIYVENMSLDRNDRAFKTERRAAAALLLDGTASEMIFKNQYRMSIDVMADGAARRIAELDFRSLR